MTHYITVDNLATLEALEEFYKSRFGEKDNSHKINIFLKVDCGYG